jgi:1-acyl-sn-glycerol-3-phosphate acyltransferase
MDRHYALVRWFLATLFRRALKVFRLRVEISEPAATPEELAARLTRPVIVLSRHAGPGDSFLLVHHLLSLYHRKPRIVMKAALQFDPSLDVVINRLPHAFVHPHRREPAPAATPRLATAATGAGSATLDSTLGTDPTLGVRSTVDTDPILDADSTVDSVGLSDRRGARDQAAVEAAAGETPAQSSVIDEIRRLAAGLGPTGALVLFPEGGNFTPSRWIRGIKQLERARHYGQARRARGMANLLPPRSGGAFAAIDAAPTADVVFVAHTGLDDLVTVGDVWRGLPMEQVIKAQWWRVPAAEVPRERDEVIAWLYDWWERIDAWIEENRPIRTS